MRKNPRNHVSLETKSVLSGLCNAAAAAQSLQSCPTLCDPIDGSPPGSPNPGILQVRTLEWVAISFSCLYFSYPLLFQLFYLRHAISCLLFLKLRISRSDDQNSHQESMVTEQCNQPSLRVEAGPGNPGVARTHQLVDET